MNAMVIDMVDRYVDCIICGECTDNKQGIPTYEDLVVPNDWNGEWFGQPACQNCFEAQATVQHPITFDKFLLLSRKRDMKHDHLPDRS